MIEQTAAELAREFDASFAKPAVVADDSYEDLLAVTAADRLLAVRAIETAAILRCPPLTAVPSNNASLAGLAGIRGALVVVYDLAALMGEHSGRTEGGWILVSAADRTVALRFDALVGYHHLRSDTIVTAAGQEPSVTLGVVRIDDVSRTVIRLSALIETIQRTAGYGGSLDTDKEQ